MTNRWSCFCSHESKSWSRQKYLYWTFCLLCLSLWPLGGTKRNISKPSLHSNNRFKGPDDKWSFNRLLDITMASISRKRWNQAFKYNRINRLNLCKKSSKKAHSKNRIAEHQIIFRDSDNGRTLLPPSSSQPITLTPEAIGPYIAINYRAENNDKYEIVGD